MLLLLGFLLLSYVLADDNAHDESGDIAYQSENEIVVHMPPEMTAQDAVSEQSEDEVDAESEDIPTRTSAAPEKPSPTKKQNSKDRASKKDKSEESASSEADDESSYGVPSRLFRPRFRNSAEGTLYSSGHILMASAITILAIILI